MTREPARWVHAAEADREATYRVCDPGYLTPTFDGHLLLQARRSTAETTSGVVVRVYNYERQPFSDLLTEQRMSLRQAADRICVDFIHLAHCRVGSVRPCDEVRRRLPKLLGVPLEDCFTAERLSAPYVGMYNGRPRKSGPVAWTCPEFDGEEQS